MGPKRVGRHVGGGNEPEEERVARERGDAFREALSFWATGVTILAVREEASGGDAGPIHALTLSAFVPVSMEPPLVLVSLGANASALPYLEEGSRFVISFLGDDQKSIASRYSDVFPVGPSPFPAEGPPRVIDSVATLHCEVDEMLVRGDHTLVIGAVLEATSGQSESVLTYFRRQYLPLGEG